MSDAAFPLTRYSVVAALRADDAAERERAFGALVAAYWRPVYKYLRLRWRLTAPDAEDATQGFFGRAYERAYFARFDAKRARFRTFLRTCVDAFAANERQAAQRLKRGGGAEHISLDYAAAEAELTSAALPDDYERFFAREWVRAIFAGAVDDLRRQCERDGHALRYEIFARYDLAEGDVARSISYAALAAEIGLTTSQVTNYLASTRRQFRGFVLDRVRSLTATDAEFRDEVRELFGFDE
ncbi:MAG: RNA polymerase sigma factor [Gemmatimonadaceae bacterium]